MCSQTSREIPKWINDILNSYPKNNICMICKKKQVVTLNFSKDKNRWICGLCQVRLK